MKYGYVRVSTKDQKFDMQLQPLENYGCDRIFSDYGMSGTKQDRQGLNELLNTLTEGDTIVVYKLDRIGRNLKYLLEIMELLRAKKCNLISLTEGIDTSNKLGDLVFHIFGTLAEFERTLMIERINQGIQTAKAKGIHLGAKFKVTPERRELLRELKNQGKPIKEICSLMGISKATYYRHK